MQKFLVHYSSDDNEILTEGFEESSFGQFFWMNNGITENNIPPNLLSNDDVAKELIKIKEEFFYSFMANDKKAITIANDFFGKNIVYYYHSSSIFIASNDFWEVVRTLNRKSTIIINNEFIKQTTIFNISLSEDTIVTGIKTLPPASYLEFTQNKFSISKYDEIKFTPNLNLDLDTIVNKSYLLFKSFFNQLKVHKKGAVFGVGLSGGQDSRMIASMALDSGLQLAPFCIGEKKRYNFFNTFGYNVAKKISKKLKLNNFKFINYKEESLKEKVLTEVIRFPCKSSNINIGNLSQIPDFDYLLNGEHGGVFFGEFDFKEMCDYNNETMSTYLLKFLSFNDNEKMIISTQDKNKYIQKVNSIIKGYGDIDRFDAFYRFFFEVYGSKSRGGFFESLYNTKVRYTPFLDRKFFDFFLSWPSYMRFSQVVQYRFLQKHFEELINIPDETLDAPVNMRKDKPIFWFVRFVYALRAKLFGSSLNIKRWILKDIENLKIYENVVEYNSSYINESFPLFNKKEFFQKNPRAAMNLIKLLLIKNIVEEGTDYTTLEIKSLLNKII
jgi:hypothetical protein